MKNVATERSKAVRDWLAGFAATLAILAPAAWGSARATADDPAVRVPAPNGVVERFVAARPGTAVVPAATTFGEATVEASVRTTDDGQREMVIEIRNPGAVAAGVKCDVSLREIEFPESEPWARIVPPPRVKRVVAMRSIAERVEPGARRTVVVALPPAGAGAEGARPTEVIAIDVP
jgi:hypothetical protein